MLAALPETINCQQTLRPGWRTLLLNPCPIHDEILMDLIMWRTVSMNPGQFIPPSVGDVDVPLRAEHSTITYSQHPGQLWAEINTDLRWRKGLEDDWLIYFFLISFCRGANLRYSSHDSFWTDGGECHHSIVKTSKTLKNKTLEIRKSL